jgi:hypothetical protein
MEEEKQRVFKRDGKPDLSVSFDDLDEIFKGLRPRLMDVEDFKYISKILKKETKRYLRGRMVHLSKVSNTMWEEYVKDEQYKPIQRGRTYVKKTK